MTNNRRRSITSEALITVVFALALVQSDPGRAQTDDAVIDFVRVEYVHGLPFVSEDSFGESAVPSLLAMLESEAERKHWANIVLVLGLIGDETVTLDPQVHFLEQRFDNNVEYETWLALIQVPVSIGMLAGDSDSDASLAYLESRDTVESWGRTIRWRYEDANSRDLGIVLTQSVVRGLGISGNEAARRRLLELETAIGRDDDLRPYLEESIREAIQLNQRISESSLEEVLSENSPRLVE